MTWVFYFPHNVLVILHCAIYVFFAKGYATVPTSLHIHPQNYSSLALMKTNGDVIFFFFGGSVFFFI